MATLSSPGVGSGLDVNSIVTQLVAIERKPIEQLQAKATAIQTQLSSFGLLQSYVTNVRDIAAKLADASFWSQTTASSSDASAVAATSTTSAAAGSYSVEVGQLAQAQGLASQHYAGATTTVGTGTLHIELGTWGVGQTSFTPKTGATAVDISVAASDTLTDVRDKINAAGAGVTALIMTDANGSRLLMRSNTSGADSAFRSSGIAALAYDTGTKTMTQNQTAANAQATVNGLAVSSTTNTLTNIVDGLTLSLSAVTTAPVSVDVVTDTAALKKTMTDFAAAYTAVVQLISTDTKYNAATKKGGILQGDGAATSLQRQLRSLAASASSASAMFTHLSDIGLELQRDGSMTVNDTKLTSALANVGELKKMFSSSDLVDPTADGFAKRFRVVTTGLLGSSGSVTTRTAGLADELTKNQKDQDSLTLRLAGIEKRMRAQYTALDATMAKLNSTSSFVTQQIAAYNKSPA